MSSVNDLTKQERIVLVLVAQGWRTAKIAQELFISPRTVETHLAHIFGKLGVSSRTEAAIYALRTNIATGMEMRTSTDDMLDESSYAYGNEFSGSTRTLMKEKLA